nr:histidine kinase dimerization/phosphoacceptor domain -containing protein [Gammaproteobacteria bacterium]
MSPRDLHRTRGLPVLEEALILAVDDTPANLVALERVLGSIEARIIRASSGEEALALCLRHRFALAILDVQMPGMDGYELAEILLGDPATSRTPIIFMTAAFFDERHIFKGYVTGAVDYIIKPYNPEMLQAKVRVFLELAQQRQQLERMLIERNRALDASEDRFDDLFELAPQALLMGRPDGSIQQSNVAAAALFGYSQEGLKACQIGDLLPDFRLSAAGLPASTLENTADLRDLGEVPTWTARRRDGGTLRVEVRVSHTEIGGQTRTLISVSDVSERVRAFESVQRSLREKEVLLKEVHHRVKNNLQVVSSLLGLQSAKSTAEEVQVILEDCVGRVRSMAIVHEQLYGSDSL